MNIYVTGPIGSDRATLARRLAKQHDRPFVNLDEEIEKRGGHSIRQLCMTMGEHEYRNREYELLAELEQREALVCACGDGVLLDPMSAEILARGQIIIADEDLSPEELWQRALRDEHLPYAFLLDPDEDRRKEAFLTILRRRAPLYQRFRSR